MFGDSFYKHEYDRVSNENKQLKQKVEKLEKDKMDLKRSIYDLNGRSLSLSVCLLVCPAAGHFTGTG